MIAEVKPDSPPSIDGKFYLLIHKYGSEVKPDSSLSVDRKYINQSTIYGLNKQMLSLRPINRLSQVIPVMGWVRHLH